MKDMNPPPTDAQIQLLRRRLLKKGAEINEKLTELLANPATDLSGLLPGGKPGEKPVERLRRFMALIDASLRAIKDRRYGSCERCGDGLPFSHLEQVPWIDTCQRCAAQPEES